MDWIDKSFDLHARALTLRAERASILARNIANSDTPGFRARDLDFQSVLQATDGGSGGELLRTHRSHLGFEQGAAGGNIVYRIPVQAPRNGNTVELDVEKSAYTQAAIRYEASAQFIDGSIRSLLLAIRGQ